MGVETVLSNPMSPHPVGHAITCHAPYNPIMYLLPFHNQISLDKKYKILYYSICNLSPSVLMTISDILTVIQLICHSLTHWNVKLRSDSLRVACRAGTMSFLQSKITPRDNIMALTCLVFAYLPELSLNMIKLFIVFTLLLVGVKAQDEETTAVS